MNDSFKGRLLLLLLAVTISARGCASSPDMMGFHVTESTAFSCEGKVIGGYYADVESGCQMFHVCTLGQKDEIKDIKFLCLSGTIFDQETRVCERVDEVDCSQSTKFYDLNLELFGRNGLILPTGRQTANTGEGTIADPTDREPRADQSLLDANYEDYDYIDDMMMEEEVTSSTTPSTTTTTTAGTTKTFRPHLEHFTTVASSHKTHTTFRSDPADSGSRSRSSARNLNDEEEKDILELLEQIEADVPRIPSFKSRTFRRDVSAALAAVPAAPESVRMRGRRRRIGARRRPIESVPVTTTAPPATEIVTTEVAPPVTGFSCTGRIVGGLYADVEAHCTVFHICAQGKKNRVIDHRFVCGSGTLFDQVSRTCQEGSKVDCASSEKYYYLNDHYATQIDDAEVDEGHFEWEKVPS